MAERFSDKVVIVTGGSRGIGLAIAQALAREGAQVVVVAQDPARGEAAAAGLRAVGGQAIFIRTDVTESDQVERMVAEVWERFGRIDALINNAGLSERAPFTEEGPDLWDRMYRVNVLGTVFPSQAVVRRMQRQGKGSIVHVSSKAGVVGEPGHAAYSAAKGAVIALTRCMAIELAPDNIRVNVVCPGPVVTDMLNTTVPAEVQARLAAETPLGRLGQPEDIAGAVLLLASDESAMITGQTVSVDGGLSVLL